MFVGLENIGILFKGLKYYVDRQIQQVSRGVQEYFNDITVEDEEIIEMLIQEDMLPVVTDSDGSILSDENGDILLW